MEKIRKYYIYFTVFITGAVILILEILGTRIISPYYGTTVYVWSSLIGVTMIALAAGYFAGGWIADKKPSAIYLYLTILLAAFFIFVIQYISGPVLSASNSLGAKPGSLISAAVLFTLPLALLGMAAPYAIKLSVGELKDAGLTSGSLYGVSTLGSFTGAVSAGFYFIPYLGITALLDILTGLLLLTVILWFAAAGKSKMNMALLLVVLALVCVKPHSKPLAAARFTRVIYDSQTLYSRVKVIDYVGRYRGLVVDGALQTLYDMDEKKFGVSYMKMFENAVKFHGNAKKALMIGLGGGGFDSILAKKGVELLSVEIDPQVKMLAEKYFNFKGKAVIDDGRHYIRNTRESYDLIYIDAFSGFSLCQHLVSKEALSEIKARLNNGGMLSMNCVGRIKTSATGASADDPLNPVIFRTLKEVFKNVECRADGGRIANYIYYASDAEMNTDNEFYTIAPVDAKITLTDNYNPLEMLSSGVIEEWRREEVKKVGDTFPL